MSRNQKIGKLFCPTVPMRLYFDGLTQNLKQDPYNMSSGFYPQKDHSKGEMFLDFLAKEEYFVRNSGRLKFYFPNQQLTTTDAFMFLEEIAIKDNYVVKKVLLKDKIGYILESMFELKIRNAFDGLKNTLKRIPNEN